MVPSRVSERETASQKLSLQSLRQREVVKKSNDEKVKVKGKINVRNWNCKDDR